MARLERTLLATLALCGATLTIARASYGDPIGAGVGLTLATIGTLCLLFSTRED